LRNQCATFLLITAPCTSALRKWMPPQTRVDHLLERVREAVELPRGDIVHWSDFERGGHFAALEAPDLLGSDVREVFRRFR
jgi:hypothetical protein